MGNHGQLSVAAVEAVNQACDQFEAVWQAGGQPVIIEFLAGWAEPELSVLAEQLLRLDIEWRKKKGLPVFKEVYRADFPDWLPQVDAAFHSSTASERLDSSPGSEVRTQSLMGVINERYQLLEKLGEGGMAVVYRAYDLESRSEVAVKVMKTTLTGSSKKRFAREFRAIAGLDHPNCIKVLEFGETSEFPFFTMELFSGKPITHLAGGELPTILSAIYQAASAIDFVHGRKVVHRDIKPSNLLSLVGEEHADGAAGSTVKLTDFGLARFHGIPSSISVDSGFVGTLAYAAPEQVSNSVIDHRADLYSLGLVCFELLTGRYAFHDARHEGVRVLMRAQLVEHPPRLRTINPEVPPDLEEVILAYIEKDPTQRPNSAGLLRRVAAAHLGYSSDGSEQPAASMLAGSGRRERSVIGRAKELDKLDQMLRESLSPTILTHRQWSQSPTPSIVFITGEAGMGKSHLMREVRRTAQRHGATVFEGRCFKGNLAPYHPFVEIVRQMLVGLEPSDSSVANAGLTDTMETTDVPTSNLMPRQQKDTLGGLVEYYSAELLRVARDLRQWLSGEAFRQVDLNREANYVLRAVASFFVEVGILHGACLLIEDLQWADLSTLDLLRHLSTGLFRNREQSIGSNHSSSRLFVCCTMRSDEVHANDFPEQLQRERYGRIVELNPLSLDECQDLICQQLGANRDQASPGLVEKVHRRCQGNPYFISESVFGWRDVGRIVKSDEIWRLDESADEGSAWPDSVRDVLRTRLETLSPTATRALGACAVIGAIVDVEVLRQTLSDVAEADFLDAVDELLARKIVFEKSRTHALEFSHDLLRELAYEQLSGSRRRALHTHVGKVLEGAGAAIESPELLAGHFYEARVADRAFRYLMDAGESALGSYAIDDALRHFKRAAELESEIDDNQQKMRLRELMATARSAAGEPLKAIACHERRLELAEDSVTTGRILEEIGKLHFRVGDFDAAVQVFDRALGKVGYRRPQSAIPVLFSTGFSLLRHFLPRPLDVTRWFSRPKPERMQVAHGVFSTLELLWAQRDVLQCGQAHSRHLVLADQIGELPYLVHASAREALILGIFSLNRLALRAGRRALAYAQQAGDAEGEAIAKGHVGCAHYFGGRLEEAERLLRDAVTVLDRRGDNWERMYFYHNLRHLYSITGDAEKEIECARVEMQIGEAVHDPEGTCWGAYGIANALARNGRFEEAHQYMERALGILSGRTNIVVTPTALQTYGFVHLQSGDYQAAREVLEQSCKDIGKNWAFVDYAVRAYPLYAESLLGPHWHASSRSPDRSAARLAWKISRRATFWTSRFPNYKPHALRVRGRAAQALGREKKAVQCFTKAIKFGDKIGARYDAARACIDLAKLKVDDRQEHQQRGQDMLNALGAVLPAAENDV